MLAKKQSSKCDSETFARSVYENTSPKKTAHGNVTGSVNDSRRSLLPARTNANAVTLPARAREGDGRSAATTDVPYQSVHAAGPLGRTPC